jgi:hypothetical protein
MLLPAILRPKQQKLKHEMIFQAFRASVMSDLPEVKEIHMILDNYCTHKRNEEWLQNMGL